MEDRFKGQRTELETALDVVAVVQIQGLNQVAGYSFGITDLLYRAKESYSQNMLR